jgi:hypothetical protein
LIHGLIHRWQELVQRRCCRSATPRRQWLQPVSKPARRNSASSVPVQQHQHDRELRLTARSLRSAHHGLVIDALAGPRRQSIIPTVAPVDPIVIYPAVLLAAENDRRHQRQQQVRNTRLHCSGRLQRAL